MHALTHARTKLQTAGNSINLSRCRRLSTFLTTHQKAQKARHPKPRTASLSSSRKSLSLFRQLPSGRPSAGTWTKRNFGASKVKSSLRCAKQYSHLFTSKHTHKAPPQKNERFGIPVNSPLWTWSHGHVWCCKLLLYCYTLQQMTHSLYSQVGDYSMAFLENLCKFQKVVIALCGLTLILLADPLCWCVQWVERCLCCWWLRQNKR